MNRKISTAIATFALFGLSGCNLIKAVNQVIPAEGPPVSVDYSDHAVEGVIRPGLVAPAAPACEGAFVRDVDGNVLIEGVDTPVPCPTPTPVAYQCVSGSPEGAIVEGAGSIICP
jgi:hypothetical protein